MCSEAEREIVSADIGSILRDYVVENPECTVPTETAVQYLAIISDRHPDIFDQLFVKLLVGNAPALEQMETIQKLVNKVPICFLSHYRNTQLLFLGFWLCS